MTNLILPHLRAFYRANSFDQILKEVLHLYKMTLQEFDTCINLSENNSLN